MYLSASLDNTRRLGHTVASETTSFGGMDKFAALNAFVTVVEERGFAAAARKLALSRSAVNRMVIALEDELGAQLLNRTTRRVAPTAAGTTLHARARAILDDLQQAERIVGALQGEPAGELRINAPMSFGTMHLADAVADFMLRHRGVRVELQLDDRFIDVVGEGFDVTVRIGEPRDDIDLVDHRLTTARRVICASPAFLAARGEPRHPSELPKFPCLHYGNLASGKSWRLGGAGGPHTVPVAGVLCSNNGEVLRAAAVRGLGLALLPTFIAGEDLQAGRLATVLADYPPAELTLCVVHPPSRHLSAAVRLLTEFLSERFGGRPYWDLVE